MRKMRLFVMLMAIAAVSFTFTSCDDDPWDDDYWDDPYGWYDDYNHGGWGWNQGDWNQGSNGSQNSQLIEEAQTLVGEHLTSGNWIIAFFAVLAFSVFFLVEYVLGLDGNKRIEILFLINMLFTVTN